MSKAPVSGSVGLARVALVSLGVAATATVALAAWTLAPQLRDGAWRWGAVALDTVGLLCACLVFGRSWSPRPELLTLGAAVAAYVFAVTAAAQDLEPVAFVTSGLASLLAVLVGVLHGAVASVAGPRPWPRALVPVVVVVTVATLLGHWLVSDRQQDVWLAALATLLAGAPAVLAVAVLGPLALGVRRMAGAGVRVAHTSALTASERVTALVLDGLATLVKGKHVASIDPIEESHLRNLKWFAGALEHASEHAVGQAIAKLSARGHLADVEQHPGLGISGSVDRHPVRVGEPTWIGLTPVEGPGITVAVEVDARPLGTITVLDTVRPSAPAAVSALTASGVSTVLLTSARPATAASVVAETGVATLVSRAETDVISVVDSSPGAVAVLSTDAPTLQADLLLGPRSPHLVLEECEISSAAVALRICRAIVPATGLATRVAVAAQLLAVLLAAAGLLAPWGAALVGLVGSLVMWGLVRRLLRA
jgi:Cu+-exporting ATPase